MSKVKLKDITYPYVNIELLEGQAEKIGINLKKLYLYIDTNINMGCKYRYGNAYKAIRERAKRISGRNDVKFSKREVAALIKYKPKRFGHDKYIKIPYKMDYIFRAIFELVDEIKVRADFNNTDLERCIDKIRRDCFYDIQSVLYKKWYNEGNVSELNKALLDDMFAGDATLSKKF